MTHYVKCTNCISLLKNYTKLTNACYYMQGGEMYIEVDDDDTKSLIEKIEYHQSNTFWYYNRLIERA